MVFHPSPGATTSSVAHEDVVLVGHGTGAGDYGYELRLRLSTVSHAPDELKAGRRVGLRRLKGGARDTHPKSANSAAAR